MAKLIDGHAIAEKVYVDLRHEIADLKSKGVTPGLAVILVGDNPASRTYVRSKDKMCRELGLHSMKFELPATTTQVELLARVQELNHDPAIHGILVQSPPPKQIDEAAIVRALDPRKDVDGFHPENIAKLALGDPTGPHLCAGPRRARLQLRRFVLAGATARESRESPDRDSILVHERAVRLEWLWQVIRISSNEVQARDTFCPSSARRCARLDCLPRE